MDELPSIDRLVRAVGGPLNVIPDFDTILCGGAIHPCIAICNALNQGNENTWANLLRLQAMIRDRGFSEARTPNVLRGPIALVWGASINSLAELIQEVQG